MRVFLLLVIIGAALAVPAIVPDKMPQLLRGDEALATHVEQRIVGGVDTTVEKYPFMANMQFLLASNQWAQACGGTLISSRLVLSAAHCYYGDPAIRWRVRLGTSLRTDGGTVYYVERLIVHERYDRPESLDNDIAIVKLDSTVTFSETIQPIGLAAPHYSLPDGAVVTHIGWGTLYSGGPQPDQLQEVDLNIIPQSICEERYHALKADPWYETWPDITAAMICAGVLDVGGRDACQGDSGGPLVHGNVLVGVVSWGAGCAHPYYPGVNARVSHLLDWIISNSFT